MAILIKDIFFVENIQGAGRTTNLDHIATVTTLVLEHTISLHLMLVQILVQNGHTIFLEYCIWYAC